MVREPACIKIKFEKQNYNLKREYLQKLLMLTVDSSQTAEHVENKIILFTTVFKHSTHGCEFTANFW